MIGIIGAMHEEIEELRSEIVDIKEKKIIDFTFYMGKLRGQEIVLVEGGIGKVNATICTTLLIEHFKAEKIIFTGVAGGVDPKVKVGDIVISKDLMEHDFDCTAFGLKPGELPRMDVSAFEADKELFDIAKKVGVENFSEERVWEGRIVSGDQFIASVDKVKWLSEEFDAKCTEMEGAAVAHTCHMFKVPFIVIRAISDNANHDGAMDFKEFTLLAAKNSKIIVEGMLDLI